MIGRLAAAGVLAAAVGVALAEQPAAVELAAGPAAESVPANIRAILAANCLGCHAADVAEGDIVLDAAAIDFGRRGEEKLWERVATVLEQGRMPPPDEPPLAAADREALRGYLDRELLAHVRPGGTPPRRLSRDEYEATIRTLLGLPSFTLPLGFPADGSRHGFDNLAEGLVVSPAHLEAYEEVARTVADELLPPPRPAAVARRWRAGPADLTLSFSAATVHGDALRLVSRSADIMRSCTWPSRIEVKDSGTYTVTVSASTFTAPEGRGFEGPMRLEVYARPVEATDRSKVSAFRLLTTIEVATAEAVATSFEADLYAGETVLFRWANAEMTHEFEELADQMAAWFEAEPRFLAAWQKAVFPAGDPRRPETSRLRGKNGWDIISKHLADPALDTTEATFESPFTKRLLELFRSLDGTFNLADALCHFYHERGPALEIHSVEIAGPTKLVESPADRARKQARQRLFGTPPAEALPEQIVREWLERFLPAAFRRPVEPETVNEYVAIATQHWEAGHSFDEGLHLVLRNVLVSPRFLYRCLGPADAEGRLDQFDLASRLSYFLTQRPPDATLVDLAARGRLAESWVLRREAERLLPTQYTDPLIRGFVAQWLDTRSLPGIMPDPKFKFDEADVALARRETERFVTEILVQNLPLETFIDPDFTFASVDFMERNYGSTPSLSEGDVTSLDEAGRKQFRKLPIPRGSRHGGLVGQAAIMMATANGVDTQPVIRGAWMLENILGMPVPPPPKNVPALTPDTAGAATPRELLAAHTAEAACAVCHRQIDPVGFVLENYDPVGRWRTAWPGTKAEIDAAVVLPDGTALAGPAEFKAWLVAGIDRFSRCLAEKLLTYATGRVPNYAERHEIATIVAANREQGGGFRDLVLALVDSRTFRAK
jgi:mono/diheme cytochrome c family protein